jgi:hypothetical protein
LTTILDNRTGRNRLVSQERRPEYFIDESRVTLQINEARGPTGRSTAFDRVYEFIALRNRIPCFDSIKAPKYRGWALEIAIASRILKNIQKFEDLLPDLKWERWDWHFSKIDWCLALLIVRIGFDFPERYNATFQFCTYLRLRSTGYADRYHT